MTRTDTAVARRQARPSGNGIVARLAARPRMLVLLVAVPLVFLGYGLVGWLRGWALGADSSVYRAGAVLFLHGRSPYDVRHQGFIIAR